MTTRRPTTLSLLAVALAAGTLFAAHPASAQQTAAPLMTSPAMTASASTDTLPLVIPPPPGGKLRVEMDARSEDLLGMMKSFLKGIGETGQPVYLTPGRTASPPNPVAEAIANGDLAAMLKDVNHVHIAVYEIPGAAGPSSVTIIIPSQPGMKKSLVTAAPAAPATPAVPAFDSNSFYESAFAAEGAHRLLYTDADEFKLVMVGFPNRQGFAFAASGGGYVFVERSDGYPDLEVLTAFISHVTTAVVNSQMGKKMMNSAVGGTTLTVPAAKMLDKK